MLNILPFYLFPFVILGVLFSYIPKKILIRLILVIDILLGIIVTLVVIFGSCGIPFGGEAKCANAIQLITYEIVGLILVIGIVDLSLGLGIGIRLLVRRLLKKISL